MTVSAISSQRVQSAIQRAAQRTGIDFDYLLGQARLESGLNARARASTSSASGLYQFIDQSWLAVMKKHGSEHGLGWAAECIGRTASGRLTVSDPQARQAILNLRYDPEVASLMAAEHASDNKAAIERATGRPATGTDLYMAHFLGLGGARQFLGAMEANPERAGAGMFPAAARANRNIFYAPNGSPRSLQQIYDRFSAKLERGAAGAASALPAATYAAQAIDVDGATVVTGAGESAAQATAWATSTIAALKGRFGDAVTQAPAETLLRPSPDHARLAYMMLAGMGGR